MTWPCIVAISGKAQAGKDTAADGLVLAIANASRGHAFADGIKAIATLAGWNGIKDTEGRRFLQALGRIIRQYNPDYTVHYSQKIFATRPKGEIWIMPDCRMPNEAEWVEKMGGMVIRIERPNNPNALTGEAASDITETALDNYPFQHKVINNGNVKALQSQIISLARQRILF